MRSFGKQSCLSNRFRFDKQSLAFDWLPGAAPINSVCIYHFGNRHGGYCFVKHFLTSGNPEMEYVVS